MGRHSDWRKIAKKCRRSRLRKLTAQAREEKQEHLKASQYLTWEKEQEALELFARVEEERIQEEENKKWIARELKSQEEWRQIQEKITLFKAEKAKQELLIREEWDREQKRIKDIEEKNKREKEAREQQENEFKKIVKDYIEGASNKLPDGFLTPSETKPDKELCPFFSKIGACRFFDHCSRNHIKPSVTKTLLLNNFFSHLSMDNKSVREYDTDMCLEYDEKEMYKFFLEFYDDALPELRALGKVTQFKVCCNQSPHLRGNVYVSYATEREALKAYYALTGRFYGGRQIRGQFCTVPKWSNAICGLFLRRKCPKGSTCNFMHIFRNPTSEFVHADMDREHTPRQSSVRTRGGSSKRHSSSWAWNSSDSSDDEENRTGRQWRKTSRSSRQREDRSSRFRWSDRDGKKDSERESSRHSDRERSKASESERNRNRKYKNRESDREELKRDIGNSEENEDKNANNERTSSREHDKDRCKENKRNCKERSNKSGKIEIVDEVENEEWKRRKRKRSPPHERKESRHERS